MMKTCADCDEKGTCTQLCEDMKKHLEDYGTPKPSWLVYIGDSEKLDYFANIAPFTMDNPLILGVCLDDIENAKLTKQQRKCLKMYYLDNLTQKEIAEILDIDQTTVVYHLAEGRKKVSDYRILLGEDEWEVVLKCNLSERQKQCFFLQKFLGLSQREIASKLGISRATVRTQLKRAENKLLNHLKPT